MEVKRMVKQRIVVLRKNKTFREQNVKVKDGQLKPSKKEEVIYSPAQVFTEERSWSPVKFWKQPRKLVFWVKGAVKAVDFTEDMKGLNPFWTMEEAYDYVYKNMQKALTEHKPMKWSQFIIIVILLIVLIVISLSGRVRVF